MEELYLHTYLTWTWVENVKSTRMLLTAARDRKGNLIGANTWESMEHQNVNSREVD